MQITFLLKEALLTAIAVDVLITKGGFPPRPCCRAVPPLPKRAQHPPLVSGSLEARPAFPPTQQVTAAWCVSWGCRTGTLLPCIHQGCLTYLEKPNSREPCYKVQPAPAAWHHPQYPAYDLYHTLRKRQMLWDCWSIELCMKYTQ